MNELTINLKTDGSVPLYEQIYIYIKTDIQNGKIRYGEKLPSTRALSRYLEVSRSTVELAYEQLQSEGFIEAEPYRGFFAAQMEELYHFQPVAEKQEYKEPERKKYKYDFTPNGVDLGSFPYHVWRKLSKDILMDDRTELFRSGHPKGERDFREAVCHYLYQARGVNCTAGQVLVGAGSDYLVMLLGMILGQGHKIAFEDPTYIQAYRLAESLSYETVPVSVDKNGIKVSELAGTDADIVYVTPSHQYPTGSVMPIGRRLELLKWADEKEGRYIVEDDYDSEFRYKGKPVPALQGYDRQEKVIYLGTFSKSIAPAIRLSYMVLPGPLLKVYEKRYSFVNSTVSKVDQKIVKKFLEEGYYERHLNRMRAVYKGRHDVLLEELKPLRDICTVSGEHAGVHLLLTFENGLTEKELIARAEEADIKVYGLSQYCIREKEDEKPTILLGYANLSENQIKDAVHILESCWRA